MADVEYEGWEAVEGTLRRAMPELGYILLAEMVGESGVQAMGRWDASLEEAIRRGDVDPGDLQAGENPHDVLLASCIAWVRRQVEANMAGRDRIVVRVRTYGPKAERTLGQVRFEARTESGPLDLGHGALQLASHAPRMDLGDLQAVASAPALGAVGAAHANLLRMASAQVELAMGMTERLVGMERSGHDRIARVYEARIASLEARIEGLQAANDALLAQVVDHTREQIEAEAEQASARIAAADGSDVLDKGLDRIEGMVSTAMAIHQGLPPEVGELLQVPALRGALTDPRVLAVLKKPQAVVHLPAILEQVIAAVEAAEELT